MDASRRRRFGLSAVLALAALTGGCARTVWVDVDATGCSEASVKVMNQDPDVVQRMAAVCALNGAPASADALRCHGHTLQVGCRGPAPNPPR